MLIKGWHLLQLFLNHRLVLILAKTKDVARIMQITSRPKRKSISIKILLPLSVKEFEDRMTLPAYLGRSLMGKVIRVYQIRIFAIRIESVSVSCSVLFPWPMTRLARDSKFCNVRIKSFFGIEPRLASYDVAF